MATTTNYSWTTPDDTALVKDGAAAIRSLGTAIDTTVFNNAGAAIAKTIVDAKGDIIAATAADTVSRLAVGANDTVLTADSATATGLKWAAPVSGAMTLIIPTSTANSGGSVSTSGGAVTYTGTTSVSLNGVFTSTYANYLIVVSSNTSSADLNCQMRLRASGTDTSGSSYFWAQVYGDYTNGSVAGGSSNGGAEFLIMQPSSTTKIGQNIYLNSPEKAENTTFSSIGGNRGTLNSFGGILKNTTQYDGFTILQNTGTQSGVIRVYGLAN